MALPFTQSQFLDVIRQYNEAVWPAQWGLLAFGLAAVALAVRGTGRAGRGVALILAFLWAWMAVAYHLAFFHAINPLAPVFAIAFLAQALVFARLAMSHDGLTFTRRADPRGALGAGLAAYAIVVYPALAHFFGHTWPALPTFGLPCPTTILTIALLTWAAPNLTRAVWIVPLLWTLFGASAVWSLGMREDVGLVVAGVVGAWALVRHGPRGVRRLSHRAHPA